MVEAAYKLVKGLDVVVRYDMFDPNSDIDKDQLSRVVIGLNSSLTALLKSSAVQKYKGRK